MAQSSLKRAANATGRGAACFVEIPRAGPAVLLRTCRGREANGEPAAEESMLCCNVLP